MPQFTICLGINSPIPACQAHLVCVVRETTDGPLCIARLVREFGEWEWVIGDWEQSATDVVLYDQELIPAFRAAQHGLQPFISPQVLDDGVYLLTSARDQAAQFFAAGGQRAAQTRPGQS
ncbi:hypothetical protein HYW17_04370 [Candidatus Uhrbacteria bacterium]|nr:hypothetical protein [Candidatus Uhrbacteria bacterium]